jgi:cytidylate kinase
MIQNTNFFLMSQLSGGYATLQSRLIEHGHRMSALRISARPVLAIGGDQLTGKSTLSKRLAQNLHPSTLVSTGTVFRALAKERNVSLPTLCAQALDEPGIDVAVDWGICQIIGADPPEPDPNSSSHTLVLEGRNPGTMASFMRHVMGKPNVVRLYLQCSPLEQAIRYVEREIGPAAGTLARQHAAASTHQLMSVTSSTTGPELTPHAQADLLLAWFRGLPWPAHDDTIRLTATLARFAENLHRDALDLKRFRELYNLDYRDREHYDIVIDTTPNQPEDTYQQALDALKPWERMLRGRS